VTNKLIDWFKLIFNYKIIDRFFEDDDDDKIIDRFFEDDDDDYLPPLLSLEEEVKEEEMLKGD
jgi:hypothetical protein